LKPREIISGLELIEDLPGTGPPAQMGDTVVYNLRIHLNRGYEVPLNEMQAEQPLPEGTVEFIDGRPLVKHRLTLGKRKVIAGVEKSLADMMAGGYRRVRVSPHLAYGESGVPGLIPGNAVLLIELWMREVG
jgi:peptidylprolyl isomerase